MTDPRRYRLNMDTGAMGQLQDRIDAIEEVLQGMRLIFDISQTSFEERFPTTFNNVNVWVEVTGDPLTAINAFR